MRLYYDLKKSESLLTVFNKCSATFGAPHLNPPFSSWDPDLLPTSRTSVYMMCFPLGSHAFLTGKPAAYPDSLVQKGLVLSGTFIDIFGKYPEICIDDAGPGYEEQGVVVLKV